MIDDDLILRVERLRDRVEDLKKAIRARYRSRGSWVSAKTVQKQASGVAETWLVEVAGRDDVRSILGDDLSAELNVEFQRILTASEQNTQRINYDKPILRILHGFRADVIVPLKQNRSRDGAPSIPAPQTGDESGDLSEIESAFVGHSFASDDEPLVAVVTRLLEALGIEVRTGQKPRAASISKKAKDRIEQCDAFVGLFTRRHRLARGKGWSTSAWIVDEKAYAYAKKKPLILLKESGVESIGGIQGDQEYLEFSRDDTTELVLRLVEIFHSD